MTARELASRQRSLLGYHQKISAVHSTTPARFPDQRIRIEQIDGRMMCSKRPRVDTGEKITMQPLKFCRQRHVCFELQEENVSFLLCIFSARIIF
ncbi:MAG: hypothetical protein ACTHN2_00930 [Nitrobacter sp.]